MTAMVTAATEASERRTILSGQSDLLQHHRILDVQILPGAGFVSMAIEASAGHEGGGWQLQSLRLLRPLPIKPDQEAEVCASAEPRADGALTVRVRSHPVGSEDGWLEHASGVAVPVSPLIPETHRPGSDPGSRHRDRRAGRDLPGLRTDRHRARYGVPGRPARPG